MRITSPVYPALKLCLVLAVAAFAKTSEAATISGSAGMFICNANDWCWTRSGDANSDIVFASAYNGSQSQRWIQVNNCRGSFCFPVNYASVTKPSAHIGLSTAGDFQMETNPANWLSFRPMTDVIFNSNNLAQVATTAGPPLAIRWGSGAESANSVWKFWDAPLLLLGELGASSTGHSFYAEYLNNGAVGGLSTFVNGADNCMFAPQGTACTWTGNTISGWQGTWAMIPVVSQGELSAFLGPDVGGNVNTYWDDISTTFKSSLSPLGSETYDQVLYPGTTHAALFSADRNFVQPFHLAVGTFTSGLITTMGDPGGFGGNHVFAIPGSGN